MNSSLGLLFFSPTFSLQNDLANYANIYVLAYVLGGDRSKGRIIH